MIEAELERRLLVGPVGLLEAQADLLVVGELHLAEFGRQIAGGCLVLFPGKFLRFRAHVVQVEGPGRIGAEGHDCGAEQQQAAEQSARSG
ncbi:hypothetical protein D3C81_2186020 [compost metagenome]